MVRSYYFTTTILLLRKVPLGRYFYAVGDNEDGARLIGIPVNKVKIYAFMISGISRARWLHICYEYRFRAKSNRYRIRITSNRTAVLGGIQLKGGTGSLFGVALGALFLETISSSLVFLKIPAFWNNAISGFYYYLSSY